jgi:hypothetical protein
MQKRRRIIGSILTKKMMIRMGLPPQYFEYLIVTFILRNDKIIEHQI